MLRGDGGGGVEEPFAKRSLIGTQRRRKCARKKGTRAREERHELSNISFKMRCRARERTGSGRERAQSVAAAVATMKTGYHYKEQQNSSNVYRSAAARTGDDGMRDAYAEEADRRTEREEKSSMFLIAGRTVFTYYFY